MRNIIKNVLILLALITLISGCALSAKVLVPKLELRTLWIDEDRPGFYYDYCVDYSMFNNCKEWKTEFYDFTDKDQRRYLKGMGFKLRVIRR